MHYHPHPNYNTGYNYPQNRNVQNPNYSHSQAPQASGITYSDNQAYHVYYPSFPGMPYMYGYQQPRSHHIAERNILTEPKTDSKPRLSKEEVERLEKVFQENPKPSSSTKGSLADALGLDRPRINNWFQNRRAKAKQERKQEEYEARRAAEKASCEPVSPDDGLSSGVSDHANDSVRRRVQPSSARFPDVDTTQIDSSFDNENDDSEDESPDSDGSNSPQEVHATEAVSDSYLGFSEVNEFNNYQHVPQGYSHSENVTGFADYVSADERSQHFGHSQSTLGSNSLPSPEEQCATNEHHNNQFSPMMDTNFTHITPLLQSQPTFSTPRMSGSPIQSPGHGESLNTPISEGQTPTTLMPTPNSFKSPPPPANIASRRNIPRPATLQTASLRSRSYGCYGGMPKTALDGPKRMDPSSPMASIRRIASSTGMHGRIQKQISGPRSPMVYNAEALLAYQSRSPANSMAPAFSGAAPPTPMTPAVIDQQGIREPIVTSACSEDTSFLLGANLPTNIMEFKSESNLKTPPSTPGGLLNHYGNTNSYSNNPYAARVDFQPDQPIMTPFFTTEFTDMPLHSVPSYADMSDGSLPTTPLYPMNSIPEQNTFGQSTMANTQFDWDTNEAVSSSRSSPNQQKSKQIQFTQNMTPQDYNPHTDKQQ
ncbi:uncharacterized protein GGS22DRAFT_41049 [Annulohypoxylon maeteangense]|uniref:uncharacterized protein n=1 Tax=Annulohypoxylon maeteangense TaxID=1927788 RepID=UPI002008D338|nr:uncharacterized protein GGS22DRAFT_41049 [Annulohypoxylon maeteangense]KAI0882799.1 hypothetical protein GGS22DRAFT_41049 [Annulohypoxylon maeteangense]